MYLAIIKTYIQPEYGKPYDVYTRYVVSESFSLLLEKYKNRCEYNRYEHASEITDVIIQEVECVYP